jgi:hypothetical protein
MWTSDAGDEALGVETDRERAVGVFGASLAPKRRVSNLYRRDIEQLLHPGGPRIADEP